MNWTEFKKNHLFSVNLAIVVSFILWQIRKDFLFHPVILAWLGLSFFLPQMKTAEKKFMLTLGKINGFLLLSLFYFVFFTPFSFFYRWFFRHKSFEKTTSTFITKNQISDFQRPF